MKIKLCMVIVLCIPLLCTAAPTNSKDLHSTGRFLVDLQPVMLSEQQEQQKQQYGHQQAVQNPLRSEQPTKYPVNMRTVYPPSLNGYYPLPGGNYPPSEQPYLGQPSPVIGERNPMVYQPISYIPLRNYGSGNEPSRYQPLTNAAGQFREPPVMYVVLRQPSSLSSSGQSLDSPNYPSVYYSG